MGEPDERPLPESATLLRTILEENKRLIEFYGKCRDLDSHVLPDHPVDVEAIRLKVSRVGDWLQRNVPEFRLLYELPEARWLFVKRHMPEDLEIRFEVAREIVRESRNDLENVAQGTTDVEGFRHAYSSSVIAARRAVHDIIGVHEEFERQLCEAIDSEGLTIVLLPSELLILEAIANSPVRITGVELEAAHGLPSRKYLKPRLEQLLEHDLIENSAGKNSGYAITKKGRDFLACVKKDAQ